MNRQIKRKGAAHLSELFDEKNALPKDKMRPNNSNAVRKHHNDELTDDNVKNTLSNVKLHSNTWNVTRNPKVHTINNNKSVTPITDVDMSPVADKHSEPMVKYCQNNSLQGVVDASVVSQLDKCTDVSTCDDVLNLCHSESDTEDKCS